MEPEEVLEQEVAQEPEQEEVVETPTESETPAENVQEQPESGQENVQNEPVAEPEPMTVSTAGEWMSVETLMGKEFEDGKTYHIKVKGRCQFMVSKDKPTMGIATNEITFKKQPDMKLWIKTGE